MYYYFQQWNHLITLNELVALKLYYNKINIAKGNFRFTPLTYLEEAIKNIEKMPHRTDEL